MTTTGTPQQKLGMAHRSALIENGHRDTVSAYAHEHPELVAEFLVYCSIDVDLAVEMLRSAHKIRRANQPKEN